MKNKSKNKNKNKNKKKKKNKKTKTKTNFLKEKQHSPSLNCDDTPRPPSYLAVARMIFIHTAGDRNPTNEPSSRPPMAAYTCR